jgi:hypothetical protein
MSPTSHFVRDNYPTFELPNDTLQLIEEAFENLQLVSHGL